MPGAAMAYILIFAAVGAYAPFLQQYYQSLGIPLALIGLLAAFSSAVSFVGAPVWGTIHDHIPGSRWLIAFAALVAVIGAACLRLAGTSPLMILAIAVWSAGMAGVGPPMDVRVLSMVGADRTRYGWIRACGSGSFMIVAPIVGLLVDRNGPAALFLVMIPALLLGGLSAVALPPRPDSVRASSLRRAPGTVLRHRPIAIFLIGTLVAWTAVSAQNSFFSIYLAQLGGSDGMIGWTWAIAALLEIPTMFAFPWLSRRFGVERLIVAGAAIMFARQLANVVFTSPEILLGCSLVQGAGYAMLLIGGVTFVSRQAPRGTAATAQGILSGVSVSLAAILGSGLGGQLAGLLAIRGLYAVSAALGGSAVVLLALAVLPVAGRAGEKMAPAEIASAQTALGPVEPTPEISVPAISAVEEFPVATDPGA